jgi:hypothetical protein
LPKSNSPCNRLKRQSTAALQDAAALFNGPSEFRQVVECGCALPLSKEAYDQPKFNVLSSGDLGNTPFRRLLRTSSKPGIAEL